MRETVFEEAALLDHAVEFDRVASSSFMRPSGTAFGPSDMAFAGFGWVSMNRPAMPTATAARASTGTNSRWPPDDVPCPPGSCTEWVASNTTGQSGLAHDRQRAHVGDQVVVAERGAALAGHEVVFVQAGFAAAARALSITFFMSRGARNWPFLMLTGLPELRAGAG